MRLIVSEIPDEGLHQELERTITLNDENVDDALVSLDILRFKKKVLIEGSIKTSINLKCSRCLKEYGFPLNLNFREEYNPAEEISNDKDRELTKKEMDLGFYINDEIDINEIVTEQVLLSVPMNPLCGPECKGLCPGCGKDLNEGPCKCRKEETDPRLAPLNKLREAMKNRKE